MLDEMRIRGLGVIDDAALELAPGLTVVTGETGAGKTMVVTGLGLLFGGRADAGAVAPGAARALVEGRLQVARGGPVAARADEAGAEWEDDEGLVLARTVSAEGRSRAHLGGRSVPVGVLAELAEHSIAVHGQSDQARLLQPARQREALDRYAGPGVEEPLRAYRLAFDELKAVETDLAELVTGARERAQEADLLRFGLDEVAALDPQPGEAADLEVEEGRLGHADTLRAAAETARAALVGDESGGGRDATGLVSGARAALEQAAGADPALDELAGRLREIGYLLADLGTDLASYAASVETDPARLAGVQQRRADLQRLGRKYGEDVLAWAQEAATRLATLEGDDDRIAALETRQQELLATLAALAGQLSAARQEAAARFAAAVSEELAALAMPHAAVEVAVTQTDSETGLRVGDRRLAFSRHGVDDVELLLRPHAGAPARPLQKGASGGELSRVMLAVEVVFAGADPVPTFVFDEVDAGVGGRAAVEIGRRLAALARTAQVIVVTHLPQVAAYADQHLVVTKTDDGAVTRSGVTALDQPGRLTELARMLAGNEGSRAAKAHARELLAAAEADKAELAAAG